MIFYLFHILVWKRCNCLLKGSVNFVLIIIAFVQVPFDRLSFALNNSEKRVRFCNHDVKMRTDRVVRNPLASDQFLLAIQALILGPFPWNSTAYLFLLYVLKRTRFVLWQNSIARTSERTTDIQGVKHHTSSWRACSYILGTQSYWIWISKIFETSLRTLISDTFSREHLLISCCQSSHELQWHNALRS